MQFPSFLRNHVQGIAAALFFPVCATATYGADTYSGGVLTIPSLAIGAATYSNVVISPITLNDVLSYTVGGTPNGSEDSYDPETAELTIPTITVGDVTYTNVIVSVPSTVSASIGGATGADIYDGTNLHISAVQWGGTVYDNVIVGVNLSGVVFPIAGGMPTFIRDTYNSVTNQLAIPAVQVGNRVYTNVVVTVGQILSVGGTAPNVDVATDPPGLLSVFPGGVALFLATVPSAGNPHNNVIWAVNGVPNGNSTVGTIAALGTNAALYTAPVTAPSPASVTISATCAAAPSESAILVEAIHSCTLSGTIGYVPPVAYVPPAGSSCDVSDSTTLANCVAAVRSGSAANVRFTATVNCSGNATCLVDLTNVQGPVTFFGAPGVSSGFLRTDSYTYPIFNISGASNITIANLVLDEGPDDPACTPYLMNGSYNYPCHSTIEINQSSNIRIEQVSILHSKDHAVAFSAAQGLTIKDSQIQDAGVFGIWTDQVGSSTSDNVSISNNLIQDVKSNGIFLSYAQNTTISGNTLQHNHHVALFDECGGLCPGGQIDMLNNTGLLIYSNQIIDGQIDLNNATGQTDGIEIASQNTNVLITNNEIANNLGGGILADVGTTGTNFWISDNRIYNNGSNLYQLAATGIQELGDCFTP